MNDEELWPPIDEALLKRLDEIYPEQCPSTDQEDREIWHYVGARSVVRMLYSVYTDQNSTGN